MGTDALFGPDGTQLPAPEPVLSDPLLGSMSAGFDAPQPVVLPRAPDVTELRDAVRSALAEEEQARARRRQRPPPPQRRPKPPPPDAVRTPPSGIPMQQLRSPHAPAATPTAPPLPRRLPQQAPPAMVQRRRSGGWIGCVVALIFLAIVLFNIVNSIVAAITGG